MTQELGKSLGGKSVRTPAPKPPEHSMASELRLGEQLLLDIEGYMDRDEDVPDELANAYEEYQGQASVMGAHSNPLVRTEYLRMAQAMEERLRRALKRSELRATYGGDIAAAEAWTEEDLSKLELPKPHADLEGIEHGVGWQDVVNTSILTAPIQRSEDGREVVVDADGISWDLTEAMETLNQPEVRKHLRQSFNGQIPGGGFESATVGAMPIMQLAIEGAAKLGVGENKRYIQTAHGAVTLPWKVGFNPDGSFRGDEEELLQNPVWTRALLETHDRIMAEEPPTNLETFAHAAVGGIDFLVFNRLLGAAAKPIVGALSKAPGVPGLVAQAAKGRIGGIPAPLLPGSSMAKTIADFTFYEGLAQASNPDTTILENAMQGFGQGVVFGVAGAAARALRGTTQSVVRRINAPKGARPKPAVRPGAMRDFTDIIATIKGSTRTVSGELAHQELKPYVAQAAEHVVDAHLLGVFVHSYGAAMAAPEGERLRAFWSGLFAPSSHAAGLGFAVNSALQYGAVTRPAVKAYIRSPEFQERVRAIGQELAKPGAGETVRDAFRRFERMRAEDPEAFLGASFTSPEKLAARERAAKAEATRPKDAALAFEAMQADAAAAAPAAPKLLTMGEFHVEHLRILGFDGKTDKGVYGHALNAVHEYLRKIEGNQEKYDRLAEVPSSVVHRMLRWRDMGKPSKSEFTTRTLQQLVNELRIEDAARAEERGEVFEPIEAKPEARPGELNFAAEGGVAPGEVTAKMPRDLLDFSAGKEWTNPWAEMGKVPLPPEPPLVQAGRASPGPASEAGSALGVRPAPDRPAQAAPRELEAERLLRKVEVEPAYQGLEPLEKLAKAQEKAQARRPSLGKAIAQVLAGKKNAAWLKEKFPEGGNVETTGKAEEWVGRFERAVREQWKESKARKARSNLEEIHARKNFGLADWVARHGKLDPLDREHAGEIKMLSEDYPDLVSKIPGRGWKLDDLAEHLHEEGQFPERLPMRELLDALSDNVPMVASLTRGMARSLEREMQREEATFHEHMLERHREALETGDAPMLPRDQLYEVMAGAERYHKMTPEQVEKEVLALRAQAQAGDPGPVMAGPPETAETSAIRAQAMTERALDAAKALELVEPLAGARTPEALAALTELVANRRPASVPEAEWAIARRHALEAQAETREALRRAMAGTWDADALARLEAAWRFLDARNEGRPVAPEDAALLKEWIGETGELKTSVIDWIQQETYAELWRQAAPPEGGEFHSFLSPLAFGGRKFADVGSNRFGRWVSEKLWLDNPTVQRALGIPILRKTFDWLTGIAGRNMLIPLTNKGPISRPQSRRMRSANTLFLHELRTNQSIEHDVGLAAQIGGQIITRHWKGLSMPPSHQDLMARWWEDGTLGRAKGPADLERLVPGTGYMHESYVKFRSALERVGRELVGLGRISQEQFDAFAGGRYLGHHFIRAQVEADMAAVNEGQIPVRYAGRSMARENGLPPTDEPVMMVPDAAWRAKRSIFEEGRTVRVFRSLFSVMDNPSLLALDRKGLDKLQGTFDHGDYELAAVKIERRTGETWPQAMARYAAMGKYPARAILMGGRLGQDREMMAPKGKAPKKGERPHGERMAELYDFFLERETYIPTAQAKELEMQMTEIFAPPAEASKVGKFFDTAFAFRKRGLTLFRPATWALMFGSNLARNHTLGGVPMWDAMAGFFGLPSYTNDSLRSLKSLMRWVSEDGPQKKPASWSDREWGEMIQARRMMGMAGTSTSLVQQLGSEFAATMGGFGENPEITRGAWMARMHADAAARGWTPGQQAEMALSIHAKVDQMYRGLSRLDARIEELLGSGDPVKEAQAKAMFGTVWNLTDLFLFKFPAFLKMAHENPDVTTDVLMHQALRKTTDALDTDPWYRSYVSMHAPWADAGWMAAHGKTVGDISKGKLRLWGAQIVRDKFWIDQVSMMPQMIASSWQHPLRFWGGVAAMGGLAAIIGTAWSDEDKKLWEEEQLTAKRAVSRWPMIPPQELEALERMGAKVGTFGGIDGMIPEDTRKRMVEWWRSSKVRSAASALAKQVSLTDFGAYPAPRRGGETQAGSIAPLVPGGEILLGLQNAKKVIAPLVGFAGGKLDSREAAEEFLTATDRLLGMRAQAAAGSMLGGFGPESPIREAIGGGGAGIAIARMLADLLGSAGVMHSPLGLFTREGQYIGEAVALDGQRWNQNLRGVRRFYSPEGEGEKALGIASQLVWPGRSVMQKDALRSPVDGWTAVLATMYPGFSASNEDGRRKLAAHRWVSEQMSVMIADLYDQFFDEVLTDPTKANWTFDEMVRGALLETFSHTDEDDLTGRGFIEPHYAPQGKLLQAIAALPEELRQSVIPHLKTWASQPRFAEDGMGLLFQAGRAAQMPKGLFREAMRNAMMDPDGTNLTKWWWAQVKDSDDETLGLLAPLIHDVSPQSEGEGLQVYRQLMHRYIRAGYEWPPVPDGVGEGLSVPGARGHARALQGGKALRNVLLERQSALDEVLLPR